MVQKVHFISIENGGFDPKDINRLDSIIGNMHDFNKILSQDF